MICHKDEDRDLLERYIRRLRGRGHQIVTTNGCFDIVHPGHVSLLTFARMQGDVVIVGLNTDESVRRLGKGSLRPVNDGQSRGVVLAAIKYVDTVVLFDDDTPAELLEIIRPDVHVKADHYNIDELPGKPVVEKYGGQVMLAPTVEGYSTTDVVSRIMYHACPMWDSCAVRHSPSAERVISKPLGSEWLREQI